MDGSPSRQKGSGGGYFVPSKATTTPDVDAASVASSVAAAAAAVVVVVRRSDRHRRATSNWRRRQRRGLAVNDATWQLVKKLVTLTVPLCARRSLETPLYPSLLFRVFFVFPGG